MSEKTFDDVDFDLFKFLSKHCLPRAPSDLDIPEWAATRDFLMSPSPSFDLSKFGSFVSPADMLSDSDISAHSFNPSFPNGIRPYPMDFLNTAGVQENWNSVPVSPEVPITVMSSPLIPSDDASMDGSSSASEWELPRRLREGLVETPHSPKLMCSSAHVSSQVHILRLTSNTTLVKQLFGDNMCTNCRESPAKLNCVQEPVSERRCEKQPVEVLSSESTPKPAEADSFRHAHTLQPSEGTIAGTRVALAELMGDMEVIQHVTRALNPRCTGGPRVLCRS
ncbi:hypothetical protein A1Q1_05560 [Trichosporon asahii var. asahii CBS 2479]|uniref:Uncharacterized protein n=1 Tax=Trichosporon asahii var. asahii (strain ATCC 90039 / CBS 2479 / JCM 2466 / KCTC 7840 / NBRC 103889/ NCYC 2677 / UAMH 7654) TaxID=1186058 RepID=J5SJS1_TRIAS|nr:hypothetical protein A1Q1_05560 [Trichosporon asahii var. asahii CBS 2479]EJT45976.1 hypothetical protein A1Q1_05560 [Trichosporon asahii var. asahii CBS 2479]